MRTVIVTGVAGSLGQRVARLLAARPDVDRVLGLDRRPAADLPVGVTVDVVDLAAPGDPMAAVAAGGPGEIDGIINLAWATGDLGPDAGPVANQHILERVLQLADRTRPAVLVHLSSATVYGAWADNRVPLTEDAPLRPNPGFLFAAEKAEAERTLAEWGETHSDVAVAVLRPTVTLGTPERPLYQALSGTRAPRGGDGARPVQFLHVDDLAAAVVLAWDRRLAGVSNVAPDAGTSEDTARALAGGVAKVALPARLARAVGGWAWDLWRSGVPREAAPYALHPWVVAPDRILAAGWRPGYSSEEALVATDARPHWDDLPPGRRQNYTLLAVLGGATAGAAGLTGIGLALRSRLRRRSG